MLKMILAYFAFVGSLAAYGGESISGLDKFESQYSGCIGDGFKEGCLRDVFAGHFDPRYKGEVELIGNTERFYLAWLQGHSIYKVHFARRDEFSDLFEVRNYLVERSDGALAGLVVSFRRIKGEWYVYDIQGGITDEFIRNMLNMQRVSVHG